jgi:hypothetical protein
VAAVVVVTSIFRATLIIATNTTGYQRWDRRNEK